MAFQDTVKKGIIFFFMVSTLTGCGGGGGGGNAVITPTYPPAAVIFSDSFADYSNWNNVDNTSNGDSWVVNNGMLYQTEDLESPTLSGTFLGATSYHLGTYAHLVSPAMSGISDYRFSVDITPLTNDIGKSQGNDVGIMFGYQNDSNYYRVSMNARYGFTRFEKRVGNTFQTFAVNARGYVDNQPMTMAAEINGSSIIVWIDGDPVFAVVDSSILSGTVALYCQDKARFDNVLITENPTAPVVAISSPLAYSIDTDNSFTARAVVLNMPTGGSVAFSLDGGSESPVSGSGNIYSDAFSSVFNGNHDVAAVVRYDNGTEASSDTNSMVGTGGDYYVTVGNSITNGVGDLIPGNNDSDDGRIVAIQGYQAILSNLLTTETGRPQIVFNEGINGDTASALNGRLDSILDRHPAANKVLLMIGTNDSNNQNNVDPDDFKADVETIAIVIEGRGKEAWLAKTIPTYVIGTIPSSNPILDATRNARIEAYNDRIQQIVDADDALPGPNFYTIFNSPTLYNDYLHPNDGGYQLMADRWRIPLP